MGTSADIAGAVIGGVGAVLFIISFSTVFWFSTRTVHYGLFQACGTSRCIDIEWDVLEIAVPKGLMIGALCLLGFGLILHLISLCGDKNMRGGLTVAGSACDLVASLLILCAPASMLGIIELTNVVTSFSSSSSSSVSYGYSFYLAWISGAIIFVGSIINCCSGSETSREQQNVVPHQVVWSTTEVVAPQQPVFVAQPPTAVGIVPQTASIVPQTASIMPQTASYGQRLPQVPNPPYELPEAQW